MRQKKGMCLGGNPRQKCSRDMIHDMFVYQPGLRRVRGTENDDGRRRGSRPVEGVSVFAGREEALEVDARGLRRWERGEEEEEGVGADDLRFCRKGGQDADAEFKTGCAND